MSRPPRKPTSSTDRLLWQKTNCNAGQVRSSQTGDVRRLPFIVKNHRYLCQRKITLRVENQALSWLKTYSTDQSFIGRWIKALEKYHFCVEHRPRTQHPHADGLSERSNDYHWLGRQFEKLLPVAMELPVSRRIRTVAYRTMV